MLYAFIFPCVSPLYLMTSKISFILYCYNQTLLCLFKLWGHCTSFWSYVLHCSARLFIVFKYKCGYFIHRHLTVFHHSASIFCSWLCCHYLLCLMWTKRVRCRTQAMSEFPTPLINLLQWRTCITVLNLYMSMNFDRLHIITVQKTWQNAVTLSCMRSSHLYTAAPSCHLQDIPHIISNDAVKLHDGDDA